MVCGHMHAQSFNAGLIAGATFAQVDGDHYAGYHQLGFTAGAYANLPLDDYFAVQLELKYSLLGAHSSDKEVNEYYYPPYSLRLHYAEIPLRTLMPIIRSRQTVGISSLPRAMQAYMSPLMNILA